MDDMPHNPTAAPLIAGQRETNRLLAELIDTLQRREEPAPGVFHFWPQALQTKIRIRVVTVVFSALAAFNAQLKAGSNVLFTFRLPIGTSSFAFPVTIDRGVTVEIIDTATGVSPLAAVIQDAVLIGYPDFAESDNAMRGALHQRIG